MKPEDLSAFNTLNDSEAAILTIYGEARGEPFEGKQAVAQVIANRAARWGKTVKEICFQPNQFSCYLSADPNYPKMVRTAQNFPKEFSDVSAMDDCAEAWQMDRAEVAAVLDNATFYEVSGTKNSWFDNAVATGKLLFTVRIGKHDFYKEA